MGGKREEEEVDSKGNTIPTTIYLKYSRFKGHGSQNVDEWLTKFKTTALANQVEPVAK